MLSLLHALLVLVYLRLAASQVAAEFPDCVNGPLAKTGVCDTSLDPRARATALVDLLTADELVANSGNTAAGVQRLGLPPYQWWSEALHGVALSPGLNFSASGDFSSATSFPEPILTAAAFDDELVHQIASIIGKEARAFNNAGRAGLDYFTPNINPFKDPRWGRGQETPGEDPYHTSQYVYNLILGVQGGLDPAKYLIAADCKHFAGYDLEIWEGVSRFSFDAIISQQDLSEFYTPAFQTCVRDAKVASVMCSYNAVNGVPSCASSFLLQDVLRDHFELGEDKWVTGDCGAVGNIFSAHHFADTAPQGVADGLNAGTDVDCGDAYQEQLSAALEQGLTTEDTLRNSLIRLYISLVRLGYFDPAESQTYRQFAWSDVNTKEAQALAYKAAAEGITLLKNDGVLPFSSSIQKIALIGPWANATATMTGNYEGPAASYVGPIQGAEQAGYDVTFVFGTGMNSQDTSGFEAAVEAAEDADAIVFAGGIDNTIEREEEDRVAISWPGNQLDLIKKLEAVGKPLVVVQFGGGQVDSSELKGSDSVNAIMWAGYPGQSGGGALFDIISGKVSPSGRLVSTQYPASYVDDVAMTDMTLRPSASNPGRTYIWYSGEPVYEFGFGLHYTDFALKWVRAPAKSYRIEELVAGASGHADLTPFDTFEVEVRNIGGVKSDYTALLFVNGTYGPAPHPNKQLVAYTRVHDVATGRARLDVTLGSLVRADEEGDMWVHPGVYNFVVDVPGRLSARVELVGRATRILSWPRPSNSTA